MIRYGFLLGVVGTIVCVTANSTLLLPSETTSGANEKSYEDKAVLDVAKFENSDLPDAENTQNSQMLNEIQDTDDENEDMEINLNTTITEEVLNTKGFASESLNESYVENDGNTNETQNTPTRDLNKSTVQNVVDANEDDEQKDEVQNENEEGQSLGSGKIRKPRSAKPSCLCTEELHRVCGTNGDTYTNPCILKCAAKIDKTIQLKHEGPCDSKSRKTRDLKKSYVQNLVDVNDEVQNENKEGQSLESGQYRKPRAVNGGPCPCTFELRRVCGTNGVTYSNPCLLKCAAKTDKTIQLKHEGPCDSKSRKTRDLKKSYVQNLVDANEDDEQKDEIQNENEEGLSLGFSLGSGKIRKPRAAKPSCRCTEELHRVCGTDGETYPNPCILKCAAKIDKTIQLKHEGPCDSKSRKTRDLKKSYVQNLVDVNDEVQNENKEGQSLESGQYRKPRAVNGGPCPCTKELRRVCGTNGVTYSNPCLLKCAAKTDKTIQLKFEGPCNGSLGKVRKTRALKKKKRCVCNKGVYPCHLYEYCPCCIDVKI